MTDDDKELQQRKQEIEMMKEEEKKLKEQLDKAQDKEKKVIASNDNDRDGRDNATDKKLPASKKATSTQQTTAPPAQLKTSQPAQLKTSAFSNSAQFNQSVFSPAANGGITTHALQGLTQPYMTMAGLIPNNNTTTMYPITQQHWNSFNAQLQVNPVLNQTKPLGNQLQKPVPICFNNAEMTTPLKPKNLAVVTPPMTDGTEKTSIESIKFHAFVLDNGTTRHFDSYQAAIEFETECGPVIVHKKKFAEKDQLDQFLKDTEKCATPAPSPTKEKTSEFGNLTEEERNLQLKMLEYIEQSKPTDSFNVCCTTGKKTTVVIYLIKAINAQGEPVWYFKSPIDEVLKGYYTMRSSGCEYVDQFFKNIKKAEKRDNNRGPNDVDVTKVYPNKKEKTGAPREYTNYVFWTTVNLPYEQFGNVHQESMWINDIAKKSIDDFRYQQKSSLFMSIVERQFSENMFKAMMKSHSGGSNFPTFIQHAKTKVEMSDNLNSHVVLQEVRTMKRLMLKYELNRKKYDDDESNYKRSLTPKNNSPSKKLNMG